MNPYSTGPADRPAVLSKRETGRAARAARSVRNEPGQRGEREAQCRLTRCRTGSDVDAARVRTTGPRHAAPKKPLFTRFHMPAGKAIALAAMPTAVLMGMGFTPTLANADDQPSVQEPDGRRVQGLRGGAGGRTPPRRPRRRRPPRTSSDDADGRRKGDAVRRRAPPVLEGTASDSGKGGSFVGFRFRRRGEPTPSRPRTATRTRRSGDTATTTPSATATAAGRLLDDHRRRDRRTSSRRAYGAPRERDPSPTAVRAAPSASHGARTPRRPRTTASTDTSKKVTGTVEDTVKDTDRQGDGRRGGQAPPRRRRRRRARTPPPTPRPSPSASERPTADDCPAATDDEGGVDNKVPLPDDPWYLNASSLLLKGADYQGIVKVRTANGTVKEGAEVRHLRRAPTSATCTRR